MLAAAVVSLVAAPSAFAGATLPDVTQINPPPPAAQTPADGALPQHDLAGNGYVETEWKVKLTSPEVYALSAAGGLAATASPAPTAAGAPLSGDYASRILVRAPQDPSRFNGRVVVEVLNATTGVDLDILWQQSYEYFQRTGTIWVGVAAQPRTLFSGTLSPADAAALPAAIRPPAGFNSRVASRYGGQGLNLMTQAALTAAGAGTNTAGDPALAWDLIGQVGRLAKDEQGPFAGYDVSKVLATGWSQSAGYLTTYVNAIHPLHQVYDGFLLGARGGGGTSLQLALPGNPPAGLLTIGANAAQGTLQGGGTPVINLQTETDSKAAIIRKADSDSATDRFRLYEVPGAAHNDEFASVQSVQIIPRDTFVPGLPGCFWTGQDKITSNPVRYVVNAAFDGLGAWAQNGTAPPAGAQISSPTPANNGTATGALPSPPYPAGTLGVVPGGVDQITRDALGNAAGGIRTPFVDAASRTYKPISFGPIAAFCSLTGRETPLSPTAANDRYADWSAFVSAFDTAADAAQSAGTLLAGDRASARRLALQSYTIRPDAPAVAPGTSPSGDGEFTVTWNGPNPADPAAFTTVTYDLQRKDADDADWSEVATGLTSRSYTFTSASPESEGTVRYRVRVRAAQTPPQHPFNSPITLSSDWSAASGDVVVDKTAPGAPTAATDRAPEYAGDGGWFRDTVTVTFTGAGDPPLADGSPSSGVASVSGPETRSSSGTFAVTGAATDAAGNVSVTTSETVRVDATAPTLALTCPAAAELGASTFATFTAGDGQSGLASADAGSVTVPTASVGTRTVAQTATDNVGLTTTRTCATDVRYRFSGVVGLSSTSTTTWPRLLPLPVVFRLANAAGTPVGGAVASLDVARVTGATVGAYQPATSALGLNSGNRFSYDAFLKVYSYALRTASLGTGVWSLRITLDDGTTHAVRVSLR